MNSKPIKSDDSQLELPVLEEVVDPDRDRARLMSALDELSRLVDRVPKSGSKLSDETRAALKQELTQQLEGHIDALAENLKADIPALVEQVLRDHLK